MGAGIGRAIGVGTAFSTRVSVTLGIGWRQARERGIQRRARTT
ncbi:hypothetical protein DB32_005068 [Sandaracinus amylolyticus]|uniref:Uncharacterized protein n=1 Tax=Sandaracinus amylolyticus TaxID=927083 RepID=A0A0F6SG18_9BACT|nr:hypothetical protein DB32_005068 [Sandaracinus amylolyticus]